MGETRLRIAARESPARIADRINVLAMAGALKLEACCGGFGGRAVTSRPKRRFVNFSRELVCPGSTRIAVERKAHAPR
jgi:hypothetical protein